MLTFIHICRYPIGLAIRELGTRKTLEKLRRKLTFTQPKRQPVRQKIGVIMNKTLNSLRRYTHNMIYDKLRVNLTNV